MFRSRQFVIMSALLVLATALSACAPTTTPAAPVATQPPMEVTRVVVVEGTPQTIVVTAVPEPTKEVLPPGSVQINGAGATFPQPVYTEWIFAYQYVDPSVVLNYQGIGSGGGKKGIIDNTIDFAGSDSMLKDEEYAAGKDLQMYPILAGAVVPIYNIEGITTSIVLDRETLTNIYLGTITN